MSLAINVAMTALRALDKKMEVAANNTANVNTDGFKASRVETQEAYPEGVQGPITRPKRRGRRFRRRRFETDESSM
jgi:flagellar basal body rod protein FlgG